MNVRATDVRQLSSRKKRAIALERHCGMNVSQHLSFNWLDRSFNDPHNTVRGSSHQALLSGDRRKAEITKNGVEGRDDHKDQDRRGEEPEY